jgi:hypothetical protein
MYESHRVNGGIAQIRFRLIGVELNVLSISLTFPPVNYYLGSYRDSLSPKDAAGHPFQPRATNTGWRGSNSPLTQSGVHSETYPYRNSPQLDNWPDCHSALRK